MGLTICPYLVAAVARGGRTVGGLGRGVEGEAPSPLGRGANTHAPQCNGACTSPHQLAVTPVMTEAYSKSSGVRQGQEGGVWRTALWDVIQVTGCLAGQTVVVNLVDSLVSVRASRQTRSAMRLLAMDIVAGPRGTAQ